MVSCRTGGPDVTVLSHRVGTEESRAWKQPCPDLRSVTRELTACSGARHALKELAGSASFENRHGS